VELLVPKSNFKKVSDIIETDKAFDKIRKKAKEFDIVEKFKEIFPDLGKIAEAKKIEKEILFLRVENSVWRSELNFKQAIIVEKINLHFKEKVVKAIKFL
jgi:hypothetical protein